MGYTLAYITDSDTFPPPYCLMGWASLPFGVGMPPPLYPQDMPPFWRMIPTFPKPKPLRLILNHCGLLGYHHSCLKMKPSHWLRSILHHSRIWLHLAWDEGWWEDICVCNFTADGWEKRGWGVIVMNNIESSRVDALIASTCVKLAIRH